MKSGGDALKTARILRAKRRYHHSLFFCHLAIEKMLKALYLKNSGKHPPFIHDLAKLAVLAGAAPTASQMEELAEIASFNVAARYDDDKEAFRNKARGGYFRRWFLICEGYCRWLRTQI